MELKLLKNTLKDNLLAKLLEEKVFSISLLLAALTSLISVPRLNYINFKVIFSLFNLMLVISAFEELKLLDRAAIGILNKCRSLRIVSFVIITLTFLSSMLVTNDVALITFVPLALIIGKKVDINPVDIIIFQTLAANIGSSLTPMGNPQNLFLFTHYSLTALQFFKLMIPFVLLGGVWLAVLNLKVKQVDLKLKLEDISIKSKAQSLLFGVVFILIILSIFNVVNYVTAFILTLVIALLINRNLLKKIDFFLLATFVCFFIFIGNISHIELVNKGLSYLLNSSSRSFFTSIVLSQFISNVPASILVANFTNNWKEVLLGVNVGGMGTLIASLASLISYKLYVNNSGSDKSQNYLEKFTYYNFLSLVIFTVVNFIFLYFNFI